MFSNPSGISLIPSTVSSAVASTHLPLSLCTICLMFKYITTRWMMTAGTRAESDEDIGVVYINL